MGRAKEKVKRKWKESKGKRKKSKKKKSKKSKNKTKQNCSKALSHRHSRTPFPCKCKSSSPLTKLTGWLVAKRAEVEPFCCAVCADEEWFVGVICGHGLSWVVSFPSSPRLFFLMNPETWPLDHSFYWLTHTITITGHRISFGVGMLLFFWSRRIYVWPLPLSPLLCLSCETRPDGSLCSVTSSVEVISRSSVYAISCPEPKREKKESAAITRRRYHLGARPRHKSRGRKKKNKINKKKKRREERN